MDNREKIKLEIKTLHKEISDLQQKLNRRKFELNELKLEYGRIDRQMAMIDGRHQIVHNRRFGKTNANVPRTKNRPTMPSVDALMGILGGMN